MAEERGDTVRRGEHVGENERSELPDGAITGPNDPSANGQNTGALVTIHAASPSRDAGCPSSKNSFRLGFSNCSELTRLPIEEHLDVFRQKPVRVSVKVNVPVNEHPKVSASYITEFCCQNHIYINDIALVKINLAL